MLKLALPRLAARSRLRLLCLRSLTSQRRLERQHVVYFNQDSKRLAANLNRNPEAVGSLTAHGLGQSQQQDPLHVGSDVVQHGTSAANEYKYKCILAASTHIPEETRFMLARVQLWFLHYRNFFKACRGGSSV